MPTPIMPKRTRSPADRWRVDVPIGSAWSLTFFIASAALTAHALASDREKAMEVGCDGYLAKPCEPRAVVAEVQRFLGRDNGS